MPGLPVHHQLRSLPKLRSIESVMPSNLLILCCPLLLLPSIFPSIMVFSSESALRIRWQKYWSFSFSIGPSSEHSGLTSFRMDWLDLLAVPHSQQLCDLAVNFVALHKVAARPRVRSLSHRLCALTQIPRSLLQGSVLELGVGTGLW